MEAAFNIISKCKTQKKYSLFDVKNKTQNEEQ